MFLFVKTISKLNMEHSVKFEIELTILFTRLGPCFLDNAELGYFTL